MLAVSVADRDSKDRLVMKLLLSSLLLSLWRYFYGANLIRQDPIQIAHAHTQSHKYPHTRVYYIQFTTLTQVKEIINRAINDEEKQQREGGKRGRSIVLEKETF